MAYSSLCLHDDHSLSLLHPFPCFILTLSICISTYICLSITASARLLVALCRERNIDSQKLVGSIVPVDALLYLLHSNALGK